MSRKICVVTGTRAEYGAMYWLLRALNEDPEVDLQIIATAMHLSHEFGRTYRQIEADGFSITAKVEMLLSGDSAVAVTKSLGLGVIGFADALATLRPDLIVVVGDRYEMLAAAQAALIARIPIAHIGGGEATEGAIDEAIRHAITKMAHWHFVSTEQYRRRVIQLGEQPDRVMNVGAINLDNVQRLTLLTREELEAALGFGLGTPTFLVTYHPVTLHGTSPSVPLRALFDAIDGFPGAHVIFTKSNADPMGRIINEMIDEHVAAHPATRHAAVSLGQLNYLSAIASADVVIGNSSSGIIEAPLLRTPTVNIGDRQRGRVRAASIIDCAETAVDIRGAIETALDPAFRNRSASTLSPYGSGGASEKIKDALKRAEVDDVLVKAFCEVAG